MKNKLFVISGSAGVGKTTLVEMLLKDDKNLVRSISYTTRPKRDNEKDGKNYFFVTKEEFEKLLKEDKILEYEKVFDHLYGTSKEFVKKIFDENKSVILVIDVLGGLQIRKKFNNSQLIFIKAPSIKDLKNRMEKRDMDKGSVIEKRLARYSFELEKSKEYDFILENNDLTKAYNELKLLIQSLSK
jgi:guanylate kinase